MPVFFSRRNGTGFAGSPRTPHTRPHPRRSPAARTTACRWRADTASAPRRSSAATHRTFATGWFPSRRSSPPPTPAHRYPRPSDSVRRTGTRGCHGRTRRRPDRRSPSASPEPRLHCPCDHGPSTMRLDVFGLCFSMLSCTISAPRRLFASYHPLTARTAGFTSRRCGSRGALPRTRRRCRGSSCRSRRAPHP